MQNEPVNDPIFDGLLNEEVSGNNGQKQSISDIGREVKQKAEEERRQYGPKEEPDILFNAVKVSEVERKEIDWLWCGRLSLGNLAMIEGDPGIGKSFVSLALATAISLGVPLPGGRETDTVGPGKVLLVNIEDDIAEVIRPRLEDMGADLDNIQILQEIKWSDGKSRLFNLATDLELLAKWVDENKPLLVVLDPIQAYLGAKVDMWRANETRSVLAPLALLAREKRFCPVCIRHLKKGAGKAIQMGLGSIDLTGIARSVLLVGENPDNDNRVLVQVKANGPRVPGREFSIDQTGRFGWKGETDLTADEVLGEVKAKLSPERKEIIDLLEAENRAMSTAEVAEAIGKKLDTTSRLLAKLYSTRKIRKTAYGKYCSYKYDQSDQYDQSNQSGQSSQT